ncbi:hypothetical protein CN491_02760 [Bacillus cereus]|uniref:Lipoprotein n=1 Tax=Bacillus cereus TaxID=1396 RepID=A0A2A8LU87_BACCE|nr:MULTISPECIES: hypothetical protein [Bacillus cereus group]PES99220.1 hypothetical protein CN491_02760 [Bacillus cereus]PFP75224.1 hypothetical protein COJ95_18900 [Bacillus cereus]
MNKYVVRMGISCLLIGMGAGCSNKQEEQTKQEVKQQEENIEEPRVAFPKEAKEIGEVNMKLITHNDQQEEGGIPVLKVDPKLELAQIQIELEGLSAKEEVYIYVDQKFVTKEEVTKIFSTFINLEGELLKKGKHTISIAQYKDKSPKKELKNYKEAKFKID